MKIFIFFLLQSRGIKKIKNPCGKHGGMAQVWKAQVWKAQVWKLRLQLNFNPCLRALQGSEHLCASVSPTTPLPLGLVWSFSSSLPCQDTARPSQCPAGTCTSTNLGAHRAPQAPPAAGGDALASHPSSRNAPQCFSPSPGPPCQAVLSLFLRKGFPRGGSPGRRGLSPITETPRARLEIKRLGWLSSKAAGAALRAGAASRSTQPPPLLLPSEAPPGLHVSGSAPSLARNIQKWN